MIKQEIRYILSLDKITMTNVQQKDRNDCIIFNILFDYLCMIKIIFLKISF